MSKVLLPKEVADSIHYYQVKGREKSLFNVPTIASSSAKNKRYKAIYDYIQASDESFKNYFNALVNGYDVEETKEEKFIRIYKNKRAGNYHDFSDGMLTTLSIFGIFIEGVNK